MKLSEDDYNRAWQIYKGEGFRHLDNMGAYFQKGNHYWIEKVELVDNTPDPEVILLKKESLQSLSDEAREVIDMILKSPAETIVALSTPTGLLTKRSIKLGLYKLWNSKFIAKQVIKELTQWVAQL